MTALEESDEYVASCDAGHCDLPTVAVVWTGTGWLPCCRKHAQQELREREPSLLDLPGLHHAARVASAERAGYRAICPVCDWRGVWQLSYADADREANGHLRSHDATPCPECAAGRCHSCHGYSAGDCHTDCPCAGAGHG